MNPIVTLHVWRVPGPALPRALWRMATDRRRLAGTPGVSFAKLLGTGRDLRFGPTSADPTRWAALVAWHDPAAIRGFDSGRVGRGWDEIATAGCRVTLRPVSSRGTWSGRDPFRPDKGEGQGKDEGEGEGEDKGQGQGRDRGESESGDKGEGDAEEAEAEGKDGGPVLVLTRARLRARRAVAFWRAIPTVGGTLPAAPGLLAAFGVGEAPLGWQGTISVWRGAADLVRFAYRQPEHRAVVAATPLRRWYAEELFTRFAVLDVDGDCDVLGWRGRNDRV